MRYPYSRPCLAESDIDAAVELLRRGEMMTQGPEVSRFEEALTAAVGAKAAVACSSGTAALHLAYHALDLGPDAGLITSPVTFLSTANAARFLGAPVAFVDVDPATGLMDPDALRRMLDDPPFRVGAVAIVHLAGIADPTPEILEICRARGVPLVEDASHALGARYPEPLGGAVGGGACDYSVFSFHAIKHLAMGEGGAVTTPHAEAAARMLRLRSHGMSRDPAHWEDPPNGPAPWYYEMGELGYNYRLTDFQCRLGRAQLERLGEALDQRRALVERYRTQLDGLEGVALPPYVAGSARHSWHLLQLAVDFERFGTRRGEVMQRLSARGIGTQVHYIPLYRQPYYKALGARPLPGAEAFYARSLSVPLYPDLQEADVDAICEALRQALFANTETA